MDVRIFIDVASSGGEKPLKRSYLFVEVIVPLTFDFMANINYSSSVRGSAHDAAISEEAARVGQDCQPQATFGGDSADAGGAHGGLSTRFSDLFDPDSADFLPVNTTAADCVRKARNHMKMVTLAEVQRTTARHADSLPKVSVRFGARWTSCARAPCCPRSTTRCGSILRRRACARGTSGCPSTGLLSAASRSQQDASKDSNFETRRASRARPCSTPRQCWTCRGCAGRTRSFANRLAEFSCRPQENKLGELLDVVEQHSSDIEFPGFPAAWLTLKVNMTLILPDGPLRPFAQFVNLNQGRCRRRPCWRC